MNKKDQKKELKRTLTPEEKASKAWNKKVNKVIKMKEAKFSLKYDKCEKIPEYQAYMLFAQCMTYGEYKHKASFYGIPVLKREELFKWYQMFFEVKTDCVLMQENGPSKEGYAKNIPTSSTIWSAKQLKTLKEYVMNWTNPLEKTKVS